MAWADRSPHEQALLLYCAPLGIPLSEFRGRTWYPGEPRWLEDDTLAAMDWLAHDRTRCDGCGQNIDESMHIDNAYAYKAKGLRCHACYALDSEVARLASSKLSPTAGFRYRIEKKEAG